MRILRACLVGTLVGASLIGFLSLEPAHGVECKKRWLSRSEMMICADPQLLRWYEQLSRRANMIARRLNYGQYLGLRHWQAEAAIQRNLCGPDRACIAAHYRTQNRTLTRLQHCLDTGAVRRSCLLYALTGYRETANH